MSILQRFIWQIGLAVFVVTALAAAQNTILDCKKPRTPQEAQAC